MNRSMMKDLMILLKCSSGMDTCHSESKLKELGSVRVDFAELQRMRKLSDARVEIASMPKPEMPVASSGASF